jgi:hypothetical protein
MAFAAAPLALLLGLLGASTEPATDTDGIGTLRAAAATYDTETAGFVVDRVVETIHAKGGFVHIDRTERRVEMRDDGRIIGKRIDDERDSSGSSSQYLKKAEPAQSSDSGRHFVFSRRFIDEYQLTAAPCQSCASDESAVAFSSEIRDVDHGSGTAIVDRRAQRVLSVTYQPYLLPDKRMDSGIVTMTFGREGDSWIPVHCHMAFTAHYLFIHGSGTVDIDTQAARHYRTFAAARTAFSQDVAAL